MINILTIASEIANIVGKADDIITVRRIQMAIQDYCTRFIRDTVTSHRFIPDGIIARIQKSIELIDVTSDFYINSDIICKKSVNPIASPLRLTDNRPFISVTSPSHQITFAHSELESIRFEIGDRFSTGNRYVYHNNYIYLYSMDRIALGFNRIKIAFVPESPLNIADDSGNIVYGLENYPAPSDLVSIIKVEILKSLFPNLRPSIPEIEVNEQPTNIRQV